MSIEQIGFLNTAIVSDQAIAGMLVISIPAIAAAIVKGGEVGLQAVAGLVGPPRDPEKIASSLAMGNMQMGNASLNNASHDTMRGLSVDMNPSLRQGMTQFRPKAALTTTISPGAGLSSNRPRAMCGPTWRSTIPWVRLPRKITSVRSSQLSSVPRNTLKVLWRRSSRKPGSNDLTRSPPVTLQVIGTAWVPVVARKPMTSLRQVDQWARKLGVSEKVAMELMVGASMGMSTPKAA
jgi:hypothetical protein